MRVSEPPKKQKASKKNSDFLHELRVKPSDKLRVFLGRFEFDQAVKGFVIEIRPSTVPEHLVSTTITRSDFESNRKFFLDISNKAGRAVTARVRLI